MVDTFSFYNDTYLHATQDQSDLRDHIKGLRQFGVKATMQQSNFLLCKADAMSLYLLRKYDSGLPWEKNFRKVLIKDNGEDVFTYTYITATYGETIYCKKYLQTGDSYKIEFKHCTTADDSSNGLKKHDNPSNSGCIKFK